MTTLSDFDFATLGGNQPDSSALSPTQTGGGISISGFSRRYHAYVAKQSAAETRRLEKKWRVSFHDLQYPNTRQKKVILGYLGCSVEQFRDHIKFLWEPCMSWRNQGDLCDTVWSLDRWFPLSCFDLSLEIDLVIANHWSNFVPRWRDHIKLLKGKVPDRPTEDQIECFRLQGWD